MARSIWLAVLFAVAIAVVYIVLPFPMRCSHAGCAADIAHRWGLISPAAQVGRFVLCLVGAFVTLHWLAPMSGRYRARARERRWRSGSDGP